jgi:hypothetical protein
MSKNDVDKFNRSGSTLLDLAGFKTAKAETLFSLLQHSDLRADENFLVWLLALGICSLTPTYCLFRQEPLIFYRD